MKKAGRKLCSMVLAGAMVLSMVSVSVGVKKVEAAEVPIPERTTPRTGNILIEVPGSLKKQDYVAAIERINEIREEACNEGLAYPSEYNMNQSTTKVLKPGDLDDVTWSLGMENLAVIRAAEASVLWGHTRPNSYSEHSYDMMEINGTAPYLENLAASTSTSYTIVDAINQWYDSEKSFYVGGAEKGYKSSDYGHYQLLLNPSVDCFGIGLFQNSSSRFYSTVSLIASQKKGADDPTASFNYTGNYTAIVEMDKSRITGISISGTKLYAMGTGGTLQATVDTNLDKNYKATVNDGATWTSSNENVAIVSDKGELTAVSSGTSTITVSVSNGTETFSDSMDICVLPEGTTIKSIQTPETITVENRIKPVLPTTVKANLSDGSTIDLAVKWDSYDSNKLNTYFKSVEFDINGVAFGYDVVQRIHVNSYPLNDIVGQSYSKKIETQSGVKPVWPNAFIPFPEVTYTDLAVDWNQYDTNHYKDRIGGSFTVNGLTKVPIETDDGYKQFPVQFELVVNPAYVTAVKYGATSISTPSGTEPTYPEATVTWSNGDIDKPGDEGANQYGEINWTEPENAQSIINNRDGGSYTVTGTYYDKINKINWDKSTTVTVTVEPATVVSVEYDDETITNIANGTDPTNSLPETAHVTWSNGDEADVAINWDEIPEDNYSNMTGGTYTVNGTVNCGKAGTQDVSVKYQILPPEIRSVDAWEEIVTTDGVIPELPKTASVTWNNNKKTQEAVTWNSISKEDVKLSGKSSKSITVYGTVKQDEDTDFNVLVSIKIEPKTLVSLSWKQDPTGTVFYDDYDFSKVSGTIVASYDNGTTDEFSVQDSENIIVQNYDSTSKKASQTVTLSYTWETSKNKITKTLYLPLTLHLPARLSISVPDKCEYVEGQEFDETGLSVVTYYDDNTQKKYEGGKKPYIISGYDSSVIGEQTITVTQDGLSETFTVNVLPKKAVSISVSDIYPQKIENELNLNDVSLTVKYNDDDTAVFSLTELIKKGSATVKGFDNSSVGKQTLSITFNDVDNEYDSDITIQKEIEVKDKLVTGIKITSEPEKKEYIEGINLNTSGGEITIFYDNNTQDDNVSFSDERITITGYDKDKIGDQTITVMVDGKKATYSVNVREKQIVNIIISGPKKCDYLEGQSFDISGIKAEVCYDNETTELVDIKDISGLTTAGDKFELTLSGNAVSTESLNEGKYKLRIIYRGYDDEYDITVKSPEKDAVGTLDESVSTDFAEGAEDEDIEEALSGATLSVPCAEGEVAEVVITKDMISGISTLSEEDAEGTGSEGTALTDEEKKLVSEAKAAGKEVKKIAVEITRIDDEPVYSYVYVTVPKSKGNQEEGSGQETQPGGGDKEVQPGENDKEVKPDENKSDTQPAVGESVTVGNALVKVTGENSVEYCGTAKVNISSVTIPAAVKIGNKSYAVKSIGPKAFKGYKKLKSVKIGTGVENIGDSAFEKCTSLKSVVVPKNVKKIGKRSFYGCKKLKKVTIKTSKLKKNSIGSKAFKGIASKPTFKCPKKQLKNYKKWFKKAGAPKKSKYKK